MTFRFAAALAGLVALAACGTDEGPTGLALTGPTGLIRVVNASPAAALSKVHLYVEGVPIANNLTYRSASGFLPAYAGPRQVAAMDTLLQGALVTGSVTVQADQRQTILLTDTGSEAGFVLVPDDITPPGAGNVKVRVINAAEIAGPVDVYVNGPADLASATPQAAGVAFEAASPYIVVPAGATRVRITAAGSTTVLLDVNLGTLAAGQIRSVVALERAGGGTPLTSAVLDP